MKRVAQGTGGRRHCCRNRADTGTTLAAARVPTLITRPPKRLFRQQTCTFELPRLATLSLRCAAPTGSSPSDTVTAQHDHFDLPGYAATPLPLPLLGGGGGGDGGSDTGDWGVCGGSERAREESEGEGGRGSDIFALQGFIVVRSHCMIIILYQYNLHFMIKFCHLANSTHGCPFPPQARAQSLLSGQPSVFAGSFA